MAVHSILSVGIHSISSHMPYAMGAIIVHPPNNVQKHLIWHSEF